MFIARLVLPKGTFKYAIMPEIVSRMNNLVLGGFNYIPFFIATVYHIVRLLPANHPYVNPANIGRFGIRHVVAEAANHLVLDRKNIDKILLFIMVLVGLTIILVQICILVMALVFQPALAFPGNWLDFFVVNPVAERRQDLAFIMLDMVFGVPHPANPPGVGVGQGFFESCIGVAVPCEDNFANGVIDVNAGGTAIAGFESVMDPLSSNAFTIFPFPIHQGLHKLFAVYSNGLLVVAVGIASYFIVTIIAETAQSGTPFGRRFNKVWAPLRIVMAFGLLVPLTVGLNSSQYLVLYAAKYGSAFATNGWKYFNRTLTTNYLGSTYRLVSTPTIPDIDQITQFMFVARVCRKAYQYSETAAPDIRPWLILAQRKVPNAVLVNNLFSYTAALNAVEPMTTTLTVRFGERDPNKYPKEQGHVKPYCGEIQFKLSDPRIPGGANPPEIGPLMIQQYYWFLIRDMWYNAGGLNAFNGGAVAAPGDRADVLVWIRTNQVGPPFGPYPDSDYFSQVNQNIHNSLDAVVAAAVPLQVASARWNGGWLAGDPVYRKGWAAAGIWYNRVAEMNGTVSISVRSLPSVSRYPLHMEEVKSKKSQYNVDTSNLERFKPVLAGVDSMQTLLSAEHGQQLAAIMYEAYKVSTKGLASTKTKPSGNPFFDMISTLLGTNGLYDMRRNSDVHPLAQLVGVGRSLVESAINAMGYGMISSMAGIASGVADWGAGATLFSTIGSFFFSIAMIQLTVGFVLFYVIPFLPFIYFFFAVGGWVKGIFEAMVGAPLWALAHIRIDAQGLPGNAALNGYFLIFEVFLRPILTVFGLLASISIYSALVSALNNVFDMVSSNLGGFDVEAEVTAIGPSLIDNMRGPIDQFFYTVIYAIIVYMMGMSSFKLIDTIPNNILRWMGQSVATFGDQREDPAAGLAGKAAIGAQQTLSRLGGGLQGLAGLGRRV